MDHNIGGDAFADVRFDGDFRPYQSEVLAHADEYLQDKKIHIVAAPGAGKTVLGLELIRRLGRPALILSPTVTIRSQWVQRFCERFLPENADRAAYVSEDICAPALIVSSTYQTMYSAMRGLKDTECDELTGKTETTDYAGTDLKAILRRGGVGTVCLDEAHHLHREWHKALTELLSDTEVAVVALTATPPYDGDAGEWKRYTDLCGEIDFEIVAPELVQAGALCPHQDYVYFNYPAKEELREVRAYYARAVAGIVFLEYALIRFLTFALVPRKTIRRWSEALLETLKSAGVVSHGAYAEICAPKGAPGLAVSLLSASGREQQIFIRAMRTMLSPVDDPVYLIVKSGVGKFGSCFACPDVFKNADEVRSFCSHLRKKGWKAEYMYTRTEKGRKALILARKRSFLNVNDAGVLTGRKKISPRFK